MITQNTRYFIFRENLSADVIANYNNQLQVEAEKTRLGIPVMIISNPRKPCRGTCSYCWGNRSGQAWSILLLAGAFRTCSNT